MLGYLVNNSELTIGEWCRAFNAEAHRRREDTTISARQLQRWMSGEVHNPQAASRRVAKSIWKLEWAALMAPPDPVPNPAEPAIVVVTTLDALNQELAMSTDDSARWVKRGTAGGVDDTVLDQLRADVRKAAHDYLTKAPLALVPGLLRQKREVFDLIDARPRPRYLNDLYQVAGVVSALIAHACADLGRAYDAETHARTAWQAADYAEDDHLRAYIRWVQANIAYWDRDYKRAAEYAESGLGHMRDDSIRLRLASQLARAEAARGEGAAALSALEIAMDAITRVGPVTAEPGVMWFDPGKAQYYAAEVHLAFGDRRHSQLALEHADAALSVFTADSPPEFVAAAEIDAARAYLGLGDWEAANDRIGRVLDLPVELRTTPILERVVKAGAELKAARSRSINAVELSDRISLFASYTAKNSEE